MTDIVSPETRSRMMKGIKGRDTKIERVIRSILHSQGFRFRLHRRDLPGRPDIVLPKHNAAIFVNGCFWHLHGCALSTIPSSNTEFWETKLKANAERDRRNSARLLDDGWRVATVWECALRGREDDEAQDMLLELAKWVEGQGTTLTIKA